MRLILYFFAILGVIIAVYVASIVKSMIEDSPVPTLPRNEYWGQGEKKPDQTTIEPFQVKVPSETITDLHERLDRFLGKSMTPPLEKVGFLYGFNTDYLKIVINYWRHQYNWTATENFINSYPQFRTQVNGLKIHFTRVTPKKIPGKRILPLLLLHGWGNSFFDYYNLIPTLSVPNTETDYVLELIIPSLPGFVFSEGSAKPGMGPAQIAVIMNNLMEKLGFENYYVHGGDWGAVTARLMSVLYPTTVLGVHSTMCLSASTKQLLVLSLASFYPSLIVDEKYQQLVYPLSMKLKILMEESGYFHLQATKPDTIGIPLADSPAGFAAYLLEKISAGTNPAYKELADGGLTKQFTLDTLLHNIMLYWITNSITTSSRIYAEAYTLEQLSLRLDDAAITVPSACARFPNEIAYFSSTILRLKYRNLVHVSDFPSGGHFAALEYPKEVAKDIIAAIGKMEQL